jgi:hypothetical protein
MVRTVGVACLYSCGLLLPRTVGAEQAATTSEPPRVATAAANQLAFDGPPAPAAPEVMARDAFGRTTIRAVRLAAPLRLDGQLDEAVYGDVPPIVDLIQVEPETGARPTEKTELWLLFDADRVYVVFRCWESRPDRMVVNDMRRDSLNILENEHIEFMFDTFYDRRNSVYFSVNPIGGRLDGQVSNERQYNGDWNPVWDVSVGRFDGGWTVETAVPFKSLRYRPGGSQVWGFNAGRTSRWKNEITFLTALPQALGRRGIFQASQAATVVGLDAPSGSRNLDIKPYVIAELTTDAQRIPPVANDAGANYGGDVKYGVTQNLTADLTYRTDFAQVEADEQQVNLTRFNLLFPEKREFFLENLGMFGFGGGVVTSPGAASTAAPSDTPILFYSRRIGLDQGQQVPLTVGGRLTGQVGRFNVGALGIRTGDGPRSTPATNFSVVRIKRDVWRRSSVGAIFTGRSAGASAAPANQAFGVDGTFAFFANLAVNAYFARTRTDGRTVDDTSYRFHLDYAGDRYGVQVERLAVGDNFNPDVGFVRRDDMRRNYGQFRFSPRPARSRLVRKYAWVGSIAYIENGGGQLETRLLQAEFSTEFNSSDKVTMSYAANYELITRPVNIAGVTIRPGGYSFDGVNLTWMMAKQRVVSGNLSVDCGEFYDGRRTALGLSRGRVGITSQLSAEPSISLNWVQHGNQSTATNAIGARLTHTITPMMFASALVQFNSTTHSMSANVRLRWEFQPGSELFVVYNEDRDTLVDRFPGLNNRALILKINRLFRF